MLGETLRVLLDIKADTERDIQQAREQLAHTKDEEDSDEVYSKAGICKQLGQNQQQITANFTQKDEEQKSQQGLTCTAVENDNFKTARPQQAANNPVYEDNTNEEDMSLSEEEEEPEADGLACTTSTDTYPRLCDVYDENGQIELHAEAQVKREITPSHDLPWNPSDPYQPMLTTASPGSTQTRLLLCDGYGKSQNAEAHGQDYTAPSHNLPWNPADSDKFSLLPVKPAGILYEVRIVSTIKNEVPLLTKINPALQVDVVRLQNYSDQGPLFWSLQVECTEHQVRSFTQPKSRS